MKVRRLREIHKWFKVKKLNVRSKKDMRDMKIQKRFDNNWKLGDNVIFNNGSKLIE